MEFKVKNNVLFKGILAGMIGTLAQNIFTRPMVWFHVIDSGVLEHAKVIMLGQNMRGYLPSLIGLIGHFIYSGLWGGAFGLLITKYPGHKYFLGAGLGMTAWIIVMFVTSALREHTGGHEEALHALLLLIGGALFGITTAWAFGRLTRKQNK